MYYLNIVVNRYLAERQQLVELRTQFFFTQQIVTYF